MHDARLFGMQKVLGYFMGFGKFQKTIDHALLQIKEKKIFDRIWAHDHTVWKDDLSEIGNCLGWLHSPEVMVGAIGQITAFVDEIRTAGYTRALLLGMGGSCLAAEVFRKTFDVKDGFLDLAVLDSTDPEAILKKTERLDPSRTLFLISTKSGGTIETISLMKYFYNKTLEVIGEETVGDHFIAITDPASSLETMAAQLQFRKIFLNDPNIGGRYSALSYFGLVPAALIGMDLNSILRRASKMAATCNYPVHGDNTAARLGAAMGVLAMAGRNRVTTIISPPLSHFGAWVEQLIAESTGKDGKGILPVVNEAVLPPDKYGNDRLFVYLRLKNDRTFDEKVQALKDDGKPIIQLDLRDTYDLCGEFFRWEMAVAIAGMLIGINPFDQPNVESAKILASEMVRTYQTKGMLPESMPTFVSEGIAVYADHVSDSVGEALKKFLSQAKPGKERASSRSYVVLQAYVNPTPKNNAALQGLRNKIQQTYRLAVTVGYGPRFLHSTGQLHKGDAGHGLFIQFTSEIDKDLPIPDRPGENTSLITFGVLKSAQALGDRQALLDAGRRVIRFHLGTDISSDLKKLADALA